MEVKPTAITDGLDTKGRKMAISNMTNCVLVENREGCFTVMKETYRSFIKDMVSLLYRLKCEGR